MISGSGRRRIDAAPPRKERPPEGGRLDPGEPCGRDAEAKEAVVRALVLEPDFCISEWAAGIRQWRTGLLVDCHRKSGLKRRFVD